MGGKLILSTLSSYAMEQCFERDLIGKEGSGGTIFNHNATWAKRSKLEVGQKDIHLNPN